MFTAIKCIEKLFLCMSHSYLSLLLENSRRASSKPYNYAQIVRNQNYYLFCSDAMVLHFHRSEHICHFYHRVVVQRKFTKIYIRLTCVTVFVGMPYVYELGIGFTILWNMAIAHTHTHKILSHEPILFSVGFFFFASLSFQRCIENLSHIRIERDATNAWVGVSAGEKIERRKKTESERNMIKTI